MASLLSCKSVRVASSSVAAARWALPAVGSRLMQLAPQQQVPCRQSSTKVQVANMGLAQPGECGWGGELRQQVAAARPRRSSIVHHADE
jgi:hypothetical protein